MGRDAARSDTSSLSVVVPVYGNEASIPDLLDALEAIRAATPDEIEAVLVVDGSPDRSYELLREKLPGRAYRSRLVLLSRNFGAFAAIRAGLEAGSGDRFAVMAADLQEPPDLVVRMDAALRGGDVEVVLGVREARDDPLSSRLPARLFWATFRRLVMSDVPRGGVDVFACTRAFRDQLLRLNERHSSLVAQLFWLGHRRALVGYARSRRRHGRSAWTLRKKLGYLTDSVFSFTDLPMRLLVWVGGLVTLLAGLYGLFLVVLRVAGDVEVPGFTMLMLAVVFFGSLNLFALGILGSYAWRAYENTKARPHHIVLAEHEFAGSGADEEAA